MYESRKKKKKINDCAYTRVRVAFSPSALFLISIHVRDAISCECTVEEPVKVSFPHFRAAQRFRHVRR